MNSTILNLLDLSKETARLALDELIEIDRLNVKEHTYSTDIPREIKAKADIIIENFILNKLIPTRIDILSEESGLLKGDGDSTLRFVIDPIDGTVNFVRGITNCSISIALFDGDQNITLEQCIRINQYLIELIDLNSEVERDFQIEVSSPGLNRPFNSIRQYQKNLNKILEVTLYDDRILEGRLNEVKEGEIEILEQIKTKNKNIHKAKTKPHLISLNEIKQSKVLITF